MLLTIDIGNTNTVIGLYEKEILRANWRIATSRERMPDEYAVLFKTFWNLKKLINLKRPSYLQWCHQLNKK